MLCTCRVLVPLMDMSMCSRKHSQLPAGTSTTASAPRKHRTKQRTTWHVTISRGGNGLMTRAAHLLQSCNSRLPRVRTDTPEKLGRFLPQQSHKLPANSTLSGIRCEYLAQQVANECGAMNAQSMNDSSSRDPGEGSQTLHLQLSSAHSKSRGSSAIDGMTSTLGKKPRTRPHASLHCSHRTDYVQVRTARSTNTCMCGGAC
jgi:hypothetical protein